MKKITIIILSIIAFGSFTFSQSNTITFTSNSGFTWSENGHSFTRSGEGYIWTSPVHSSPYSFGCNTSYGTCQVDKSLNPFELNSIYIVGSWNGFSVRIKGLNASSSQLYSQDISVTSSFVKYDFSGWTGISKIQVTAISNGWFVIDDIEYTNMNVAPSNITLDNSSVFDGDPSGTTVGTFSTTDTEDPGSHTYTFASGGIDNSSFTIEGNTLKTAFTANYATKSSYLIKVRSTDQGSLYFEKDLTITVNPAAIIWDGPVITFSKGDYVDWTLEANQDRMTDNVWITRADNQGIFNINTESSYSYSYSPEDTEWATGSLGDFASLSYEPWEDWALYYPPGTVGVNAVMHIISENIYMSIKFTFWKSGGGGGFTYERSTPGITAQDLAWTGATDTDWGTPSNWDLSAVPTAIDNVTIPSVTNDPIIDWQGAECNNLTIESGASLHADGALITNGTVTNNGTFIINAMHSTGVWELIGIPVADQTANIFLGNYLQTYTEATDTWNQVIEPTTALDPGLGYALWENTKVGIMTYTGTPNTGDYSRTFTYTPAGNPLHYGFNLMGNPYPSYIDWSTLNVTYGAIYHYDGYSYSSWNGTGLGSQYVNPSEGFMIAPGSSGTLNLTNDCRVLTAAAKSSNANVNTISLSAGNESYTDGVYIVFNESATSSFDLQYDAWKILTTEDNIPQLFTLSNEQQLSIDQQPACDQLALGFTCMNSGTFTIAQQLNNFSGVLFLEDLKTGTIHDLSKSSYTFDWNVGEDIHRFNLHFSPMSINNATFQRLSIYTVGDILFVNNAKIENLTLSVFDLIGKQVMNRKLNQTNNEIPLTIDSGVYLVTVSNGTTYKTQKVYVK